MTDFKTVDYLLDFYRDDLISNLNIKQSSALDRELEKLNPNVLFKLAGTDTMIGEKSKKAIENIYFNDGWVEAMKLNEFKIRRNNNVK